MNLFCCPVINKAEKSAQNMVNTDKDWIRDVYSHQCILFQKIIYKLIL